MAILLGAVAVVASTLWLALPGATAHPCDVLSEREGFDSLAVDFASGTEPHPAPLVAAVEESFRIGGMSRHLSSDDLDPVVADGGNLTQVGVQDRYAVLLLEKGDGYIAFEGPRLCSSIRP